MLSISKASAGSGKTFTLTREYIKYLLAAKGENGRYRLRRNPSSEHSRILAITFTNKATAEMTKRIIKELAALRDMVVDGTPEEIAEADARNPFIPYFINELGCTRRELSDAAGRGLTDLLYDYSYFNVSTIDSFFQSVLRQFTREVDLPDNFQVELNNRLAITIGINEMIDSLSYRTHPGTPEAVEQKWVSDWLLQFMEAEMNEGKVFNVFSRTSSMYSDMIESFSEIMNDDFKKLLPQLREYFEDRGRIVRFVEGLRKMVNMRNEAIMAEAAGLLSILPEKGVTSHVKNAIVKMSQGAEVKTDAPTFTKMLNKSDGAFNKGAYNPVLSESFSQLAKDYLEYCSVKADYLAIRKQVYIFGLLSVIVKGIDAYCRENSLLLLNNTNDILQGLINDDETPFIYEKLGYYLDHFLIDEFQDTSPMQWNNLKPLVMESLGRGNDDLVIGDEKQCIYRFRNSDPELLGRIVQQDTARRYRHVHPDDLIKVTGHALADNNNWRSAPEIVRFNNSLFFKLAQLVDKRTEGLSDTISASETYSNIIQRVDPKRLEKVKPGYVKMTFFSGVEEDEELTANQAADLKALTQMTDEIKRQLSSGYSPCDIAVLVRYHHQGNKVIAHLLEAMDDPESGLPRFEIMSNEALKVNSCPSVQQIVTILRLVNLPEFFDRKNDDGTTERKHSNSYRRTLLLNRFQLSLHRTHPDGTPFNPSEALEAALTQGDTTDEEYNELRDLLRMDCLNLPAVVERIIDRFVSDENKHRDNLFLAAFQDLVIEQAEAGCHDISSFISWWDKGGKDNYIVSPPNDNAITVTTIHQSKGLEYPCVHIPFASSSLFKHDSIEWMEFSDDSFAGIIDPEDVPPGMPVKMYSDMGNSPIFGAHFNDCAARARIDELNATYVAFTRPTRELIVYSAPTSQKAYKAEELYSYLLSAVTDFTQGDIDALRVKATALTLEHCDWLMPLTERLENSVLTIGEPTTATAKKPRETPRTESAASLLPDSYPTVGPVELKACTDPDVIDPFNPDIPRHRGRFMHDVMSLVTTRDRLDYALNRRAYRYHVDGERLDEARECLEMMLAEPGAARWFDNFERVITERDITGRTDTRRPDRIVFFPDDSVEIVDYKFVDHLPDDLDNDPTHRKYCKQVARYCRYIASSTGKKKVRGFVWYICQKKTLISPAITI